MRRKQPQRPSKAGGAAARAAALMLGLTAMTAPRAAIAWPQQVGPFAYVEAPTPFDSTSVSALDTSTNKVGPSIPVGVSGYSAGGSTVTPDGRFVYVGNERGASVIDASTNKVVASIPLGGSPLLAVAPDGKFVYAAVRSQVRNAGVIVVIDTSTNKVIGSPTPIEPLPMALVVTPDGKHVYVAVQGQDYPDFVLVMDTASRKVVSTIAVDDEPNAVAVTPDGKYVYVANQFAAGAPVWVIETATNKVVKRVYPYAGQISQAITVNPNGKFVYVLDGLFLAPNENFYRNGGVSVIATATNTVVGDPIPVGDGARGIAITPDGKFLYVTNEVGGAVSVIDTITNKVVGSPIPLGIAARGVAIVPAPPGQPFREYRIAYLDIAFGALPNQDIFNYYSYVTLGSTASNGIRPDAEPLTLQIGSSSITLPAGSFKKQADGSFVFIGKYQGVQFDAYIRPSGTLRYLVHVLAIGVNLAGTANPVQARLIIGDDAGLAAAKATLHQPVSIQASKQ